LSGYAIILSTRDGASFLEPQLESLRDQTAPEWRLYVRDDGSRDDTAAILRSWAAREARIRLLPPDGRNLGAAESFGVLMQHALEAGERHVFLCDQDDVWMTDKCERMLRAMREAEVRAGESRPVLVHSDLRVVDDALAELHPSFAAQHGFPREREAARLLLFNTVTGCAALANAALLRCVLPMPRVAMHDWWLAQCAAAFGEVVYLDEPTVLYRQHARNLVGARGWSARAGAIASSPRGWWTASAPRFLLALRQLWTIRERSRERGLMLAPDVGRALDALWEGLGRDQGPISRLRAVAGSGALPPSLPLRLIALARVAALPLLRARFGDERGAAA
jgi:hypothetical protein